MPRQTPREIPGRQIAIAEVGAAREDRRGCTTNGGGRAMTAYRGGCLCGSIRYEATGQPDFPHLCSCRMCQTWSGALTIAWVAFPRENLAWTGPGGAPRMYRSSEMVERGFC